MSFRQFIPTYSNETKSDFKFRFTVFTPVYNAQNTIDRVHKSLLKQTFTDFEWLIINDGSSDQSDSVIQSIIETSPLTINYINNKTNKHKIACFMDAIQLAKGEFLLTFDADDECVPNALEVFDDEYNTIPEHLKSSTCAVTGLCIDQNNHLVGDSYPTDPYYSNTFKTYAIDNIQGEKWGFTKTNVLRGIKYTEAFISHGYMPEGLIWSLLAQQGYQTKYINKVLRIYYLGIENSISSSAQEKVALGTISQYVSNFNWFFENSFYKAPKFFLKNLYFLLRASKYLDFNLKNYTTSIDSFVIKFFFVLLWPFRKFLK